MHTANDQPLIEKLGYTRNQAVDTVDAPEWFMEYLRGNGIHTHAKLPSEWLHMFMTDLERTEHFLAHLKFNEIQKGLWISWPAKGQQRTDITKEALGRALGAHGWVATDACQIDQHWHALKFVEQD